MTEQYSPQSSEKSPGKEKIIEAFGRVEKLGSAELMRAFALLISISTATGLSAQTNRPEQSPRIPEIQLFPEKPADIRSEKVRALLEQEHRIDVSKFELGGLRNEDIEHLLRRLPKFLNRNIDSVRYRNVSQKMSRQYWAKRPIPTNASQADIEARKMNVCAAEFDEDKRRITFFKFVYEETPAARWAGLESIIVHELFHSADSKCNRFLTQDQKNTLEKKVIARVQSPNRFRSNYVEDISNRDKKIELGLKVREYWAEIGSAYFTGKYALLPSEDRQLIEDTIRLVEPDFDKDQYIKVPPTSIESPQ